MSTFPSFTASTTAARSPRAMLTHRSTIDSQRPTHDSRTLRPLDMDSTRRLTSDHTTSPTKRIEIDSSRAVAELVDPDARLVEQAHQQVRHRHVVRRREREVASALQPAGSSARDHQRQVDVQMHVRIAHRAAVEQDAVVEQVAVAVRRRAQLLEEVGEQLRLIRVEPRDTSRAAPACRRDGTGRDAAPRCRSRDSGRLFSSRPYISVNTRVRSAWKASHCRSNSSFR